MKALVFHEPELMEVTDSDQPGIRSRRDPGSRASGVCGTDRRILKGTKTIHAPRVIGHQFAGVVHQVREGSQPGRQASG